MTRRDAWTDMELQELYEVVNDADWYGKVAPFLDRSEAAIRAKMSALRREAGIVPRPGPRARSHSVTVRESAAAGSVKLRDAMLALVA